MSDGISWYYENLKAEEKYKSYIESGKVQREYLESDIIRLCTKKEIALLVTRLILHQLGGIEGYLKDERHFFHRIFMSFSKKEKINFIKRHSLDLGLEVEPTTKMDKIREKIEEMNQIASKWSQN